MQTAYVILSYIHDCATGQSCIQAAYTRRDNKRYHHIEFDGALYYSEEEAKAAIEEFGNIAPSDHWRYYYVIQPVHYLE